MPKIRFNKQQKQLEQSADNIIKRNALIFHAEIVAAWPVALINSQGSKSAWAKPIKDGMSWVIGNNFSYSPILWRGRINTGKGMTGSLQLPMGGSPILNRTVQRIKKDFKAMR